MNATLTTTASPPVAAPRVAPELVCPAGSLPALKAAIDHGAEGVEEITEDEFEADAQRIQSEALAALKSEGK